MPGIVISIITTSSPFATMAIRFCTYSTSLSTDSNCRNSTSRAIRCDSASSISFKKILPSTPKRSLNSCFTPFLFPPFLRCWVGDVRHPPIRARSPLCRVVNGAANQPLGLSRPWGLTAYPPTQQSTNMCFGEVYFSWHQPCHLYFITFCG